jgi:hypothetical protein
MQRRTFIKAGLIGTLVLAAGGAVYRRLAPASASRYALDDTARRILAAIVPVIVGSPMSSVAAAQAVEHVGAAIAGLPLATQKEVADLFGLLALAPTRRLLAGVPSWDQVTPAQVAAFLQDWRTHRLSLLQTAYHALHDLVLGAWYADPASWQAIGYPGPLQELSA